MAADELPLLTVEVYDQSGVRIAGEVELQVVSVRSGEDYSAGLTKFQGHVPEGSYRLKVSALGFNSYQETVLVTAPTTVVRVGLAVGDIGDLAEGFSRSTTELISGYVDSELSKGRDLWVQAYPIFRPQEQGRVTRINRHGEFKIQVPVHMGPWLLAVVEMLGAPTRIYRKQWSSRG
jgi:hypothetical protein